MKHLRHFRAITLLLISVTLWACADSATGPASGAQVEITAVSATPVIEIDGDYTELRFTIVNRGSSDAQAVVVTYALLDGSTVVYSSSIPVTNTLRHGETVVAVDAISSRQITFQDFSCIRYRPTYVDGQSHVQADFTNFCE